MSKIYSVVDADEAIKYIGKEGYFGNSIDEIKRRINKGVLIAIKYSEETIYCFTHNLMGFPLFQPIEKQWRECRTFEEALSFLGKIIKHKEDNKAVLVTSVRQYDGDVYINSDKSSYYYDNYETLDDQPVGVCEKKVVAGEPKDG